MFGECVLHGRSTRNISPGGCSDSIKLGEGTREAGQLHALAAWD